MRKLFPQETRRVQRSIVSANDWKLVGKKKIMSSQEKEQE